MVSTDLKQGNSYPFTVIKEKSQGKFFRVSTDDGQEFNILKFKFQHKEPLPLTIQCYVKSLLPLSLSQDISVHISNFYEEGEEYGFTVKEVVRDENSRYELKDDNGLCFKLYNSPAPLSKGAKIRCKVLKIKDAYVNLKYVGAQGSKFSLEFHTIEQWLHLLGIPINKAPYFKKLLTSVEEFHPAMQKYENHVPGWTLDLMQICTNHITEWLEECRDDIKKLRKICDRLELGRKLALYMVQESDFLRYCSPEHRNILQSRISTYVELFEQYKHAASMILDNSHVAFIDGILRRLKISGYLYKPSVQIRIMMTILKLRPEELINSRMGELFEALHNWDISNWQIDPFREALVQQLQLFIEENSGKANILPANDSNQDNKKISRMILAIAIQRLLAIETDNIDLSLNRASLYRYISYLYPSEVNRLLEKAICSLLGLEIQNEYTWSDTENPTLLFVKSAHPQQIDEDRNLIVKSYITSKAELQLSADKLHIIGKDADPETTVIPNSLFDWLTPSISLVDTINFPSAKKSNDLRALREVWDSIAWSLFGGTQDEVEHIEKRFPDEGEEVSIIIDDVRIIDYGHEKQRLQFHCTIQDDSFYGEGWMPCDAYHMVSWLSSKDIPGNYDKSLDFALDSEGNPLLYTSNVHIKNDGSLEFSMKSQIEEFLLENSYPGKESIAIVTYLDKINNAWLCLSETGATYKVACDETTSDLSEGKLVRVSYIEQDRSTSPTQFFIGELSKNQNDIPLAIKKKECLINLMQNLGTPVEEELPYQVMESTQIMTKNELLELIYILQRRAFSETEYVKAYNFLGIASILCRLAENKALLKDISVHMKLLEFLQEFSKNRRLDYKTIESLESEISDSPMLESLYNRIKIVSSLDSTNNSPSLWELHQNPRNEIEGKLASLVLSYNMLPKEMETSRKPILDEISKLLNINNTISDKQYYGDESQTIEFKSSMVYASKSGSRPDPKTQLFEITHTICGFMNARGGKLFIGVNDKGFEIGLEDDMTYRRNRGEKASLDGMIVDLQNHLDRVLPSHAKAHWEISSDPKAKKGVIVVDVKPVRQPVELDGVIYVRASSTIKPRLGAEREEFIKSRSNNYNILMALWGIPEATQEVTEDSKIDAANKEENDELNSNLSNSTINEKTFIPGLPIMTGGHRPNILHDYEENFVSPSFYIYFTPEDAYFTQLTDLYIDSKNNPEECRLALAIREEEKESFLLFRFIDNKIRKISIEDISQLPNNQIQSSNRNVSIAEINVGFESDYLLSIIRGSTKGIYYRLDKIGNMKTSGLNEQSVQSLLSIPHSILLQEVVSADKLNFFDNDSINRDSTFNGIPVPIGDGRKTEEERIKMLLEPIRNSN